MLLLIQMKRRTIPRNRRFILSCKMRINVNHQYGFDNSGNKLLLQIFYTIVKSYIDVISMFSNSAGTNIFPVCVLIQRVMLSASKTIISDSSKVIV